MTVEEKVGQMTQLTIDMVTKGKDQQVEIDQEKLDKAISKYGVGSILNVTNQALTLDHWARIIGPIQAAAAKTRLKIPVIYGVDSIPRSKLRARLDAFPAGTWDGRDMESGIDAAWSRDRCNGNTCGGNSVEFFTRSRCRQKCDVAASMGNFW